MKTLFRNPVGLRLDWRCGAWTFILAATLWAGSSSFGQTADSDVFAQNRQLGRGVNVLGYDPIWRNFDQARFQVGHFKQIKQGGFDSVRVNLHPFRFMGVGPDYPVAEGWWKTLDWIVTNALASDLRVILDLHEFNAMGNDPQATRGKFLAFWRQTAARFQQAPSQVFFEVLNEPNGKLTPELWNQFLGEALALIRPSNPARTVIVGPAFWNSVDHLGELRVPEPDRHLIVTVHYHKPMDFTHQGASWAGRRDKLGVEWRGTPEEQAPITRDFQKVQDWSAQQKRPILLGEFGAYDKGDMPSRARYTAFVARTAERHGWSWAYWQFDSDFIVYDIAKGQWVEAIRQALIPEPKAGRLGDFEDQTGVGKIEHPGTADYSAAQRQYRVTGSGANIWGKEDAFHFVWRKTSGDLTLSGQVEWVGEGKNAHRKACWMVRQGLDADAPYADVAVHGDGSIALQYRKLKGGPTAEVPSTVRAPAAVRLERRGDLFTLWVARPGENFQSVGSMPVPLSDPVYAGLAVSAHDATVSETAIFSATVLKTEGR